VEIIIQFSTAGVGESKNYPVVFRKTPQKVNENGNLYIKLVFDKINFILFLL